MSFNTMGVGTAARTAAISASTPVQFAVFTKPRLTTMSISFAPRSTEPAASAALTSAV